MYLEAGFSKNCFATNSGSSKFELGFWWLTLFKYWPGLGGLTWALLSVPIMWMHRGAQVKGTVSRDFLLQVFCHESSPSKPLLWFKIFFHLPPLSMTPVVHLEAELRIFDKIRNGPNLMRVLRGLGETDSWIKTWSRKSRGTVPLKTRRQND